MWRIPQIVVGGRDGLLSAIVKLIHKSICGFEFDAHILTEAGDSRACINEKVLVNRVMIDINCYRKIEVQCYLPKMVTVMVLI